MQVSRPDQQGFTPGEKLGSKIGSFLRGLDNRMASLIDPASWNPRPYNLAREAFEAVSEAGFAGQRILATFDRDFDLTQRSPGDVFRLTLSSHSGYETDYHWFAIGGVRGERVDLYGLINVDLGSPQHTTPYLLLKDPYELVGLNPRANFFQIPDALYYLSRTCGRRIVERRTPKVPLSPKWQLFPRQIDIIVGNSRGRGTRQQVYPELPVGVRPQPALMPA